MLRRLLLTVMMAGFVLMRSPGCSGGPKTPVAARPDTSVQTRAICDTTLDTTAAAGIAVQPDTLKPEPAGRAEPAGQKPKPAPEKSVEKPKQLPKMWEFGSTTCLPCKTMKEILDPMIVDYKDKVDIRMINVYEQKEQTREFKIVTIPTQVFIDARGTELHRHIGVYPRDSIEACFARFGFPVIPSKEPPKPLPPSGGT